MAIQSINIEGPCCCRRSLLGHLGPTDQASSANTSQFDFHWYYEPPVARERVDFQHTECRCFCDGDEHKKALNFVCVLCWSRHPTPSLLFFTQVSRTLV